MFNRLKKAAVAALAASFLSIGLAFGIAIAAPAQAAAPANCGYFQDDCPPPIYKTPTPTPVRGKLPGGKG